MDAIRKPPKSFFERMFNLMFLYLQYPNKISIAKMLRHQIVTGAGISMYLPKAPDVLIKKVAKVSSKTCLKCWSFTLGELC